jgi:hypothetical protein
LLQKGRVTAFATVILMAFGIVYFIRAMRLGKKYPMRRLTPLDAIEEAVGRATELGKPVFFSPGNGDIVGAEGMQVLAGMDILSFVVKRCAEYNCRIVCTVSKENVLAVTEEVVRSAYAVAGRPDAYQPDMVRFLSPTQMAFAAASIAIMRREQVAAAIFVGPYYGEGLIMTEAAAEVGAISIAGTARMSQLPLMVASCDYVLLGEEMYAGSAYLSGDPVSVGNIAQQDIAKVVVLAVILIGSLLQSVAITWVRDLLRR